MYVTNIMVISLIETVLDTVQQDRIWKKKRKIEIIKRLPFMEHSTHLILLFNWTKLKLQL